MDLFPKLYDYEERLVRFAGETIFFLKKFSNEYVSEYYRMQLIRSTGSSVLNYGEAQGTVTDRDFVHKMSIVLK